MSIQETRKNTVDIWILDPNVKLKSKNVNTKYSSMHSFVYQPQISFATLHARRKFRKIVLFFEPNLKQPKIKIILDTAKNVTTENLLENHKN